MTTELLAPGSYPQLSVRRIESPNRFWAVPILGLLVKGIILIPVFAWLYVLFLVWAIVILINSLMVLFAGEYWATAHSLTLGLMRLGTKVGFYLYGLTDRYPGFGLAIPAEELFSLDMPRPSNPSRAFAFPLVGGFVRGLLLIPFEIWASLLSSSAYLAVMVASFPVLFAGRYPQSLFELARDAARLYLSSLCYFAGLSDSYPSFSISFDRPAVKWLFIVLAILLGFANFLSSIGSFGSAVQGR